MSFFMRVVGVGPGSGGGGTAGDQLYMVGYDFSSIYEYSVDTAYDLGSTVSYTGNTADVSNEDGFPYGMALNNDGTKFYMVGSNSESIHEYSVDTAYDLSSTVSYTGNSVDVSSEASTPQDIAWNNDGTKFYIFGSTNGSIYEYSVDTAYDLGSTVSYTNNSFDFTGEDSSPSGIAWNNDGAKLYMVGSTNDSIYEYSVDTAYDLGSTVSYTNNSVDVSGEDSSPHAIAWNNDGTKLHMLGVGNDSIYEYSVSTAYDLGSTVSYTSNSVDVSGEDGSPSGIAWDVESETGPYIGGEQFYVVGDSTNDYLHQYDVTTAYDLGTVSYNNERLDVSSEDNFNQSVAWDDDGTNLYILGGSLLYQYDVGTDYDATTASYNNVNKDLESEATNPADIAWSSTGHKLYSIDYNNNIIYEYDVGTDYDISTATYNSVSKDVSSELGGSGGSLTWNNNGDKLYVLDSDNAIVYQYSVGTDYDISTATYNSVNKDISGVDTYQSTISWNNNGAKFFSFGSNIIYEYSASTAYDVSTVSYSNTSYDVSNEDSNAASFTWDVESETV